MTSAQDLAGLPSRPCSCYCDLLSKLLYFATYTSPSMHLICPPKFCISIVFNFSWDGCNTQEKRKTKAMQNFGKRIRSGLSLRGIFPGY